jgi:hypothetical protein
MVNCSIAIPAIATKSEARINFMEGDFSKHELALMAGGLFVMTILVIVVTWLAVNWLAPSDPLDPLTKAGGLNPAQDIRKVK